MVLQGLRVLELDAGTGLIALYCYRKGAIVTASDVTNIAIQNLRQNTFTNKAEIEIIESDLFDRLDPNPFNIVIINPPFYSKEAKSEKERAWLCGENFEYLKNSLHSCRKKEKTTIKRS